MRDNSPDEEDTWKGEFAGYLDKEPRESAVRGGDVKRVSSDGRGVKVPGEEGESMTQLHHITKDVK